MSASSLTFSFAPLGALTLTASDLGLARVEFRGGEEVQGSPRSAELVACAREQILAYLRGERRTFDLPLDWQGISAFQRRALEACAAIPYGQRRTYGDLARQLGSPRAARAVGMAMSRNPLPLVIPCHRVIGTDGSLHGFAAPGGVRIKAWLLNLEGALLVA